MLLEYPIFFVSLRQGPTRGERTAEAAPEAGRQAVGGGYESGWGRLLSVVIMPLKPALGLRETVAGHRLGALEGGGGHLTSASVLSRICI